MTTCVNNSSECKKKLIKINRHVPEIDFTIAPAPPLIRCWKIRFSKVSTTRSHLYTGFLRNKYVDEQCNADGEVENEQRPSPAKPAEQLQTVGQSSLQRENCDKFTYKKQGVS